MQMIWIPSRRRFVGTQGEARAEKVPFEVVEFPDRKSDVIDALNKREEEYEARLSALTGSDDQSGAEATADAETGAGEQTAETHEDAPATTSSGSGDGPPSGRMLTRAEVVEHVMELSVEHLPPVLSAAIGRLGEVAGNHGWGIFGKDVYSWSPGARNVEQGLGMLMLAAMETMTRDPKPKPTCHTPIMPVEGQE